jgi:hypothetical protein
VDALLDDIQALHLAACRRARLDPEDLAGRLLGLETGSEYGFSGAASTYANLLGTKGLAEYGGWPKRNGRNNQHSDLARIHPTTLAGRPSPPS